MFEQSLFYCFDFSTLVFLLLILVVVLFSWPPSRLSCRGGGHILFFCITGCVALKVNYHVVYFLIFARITCNFSTIRYSSRTNCWFCYFKDNINFIFCGKFVSFALFWKDIFTKFYAVFLRVSVFRIFVYSLFLLSISFIYIFILMRLSVSVIGPWCVS